VACFKSLSKRGIPNLNETALCIELHYILRVLWSGKWAVITPFALLEALWKFVPRFRNSQQHDAQEFLSYLLDRLHHELTTNHLFDGVSCNGESAKNGYINTVIHATFEGKLLSEVTCLRCKNSSKTYDPLLDLCLDIPKHHVTSRRKNTAIPTCSIEDCLDNFTKPESLEENSYFCEFCKTKQAAVKRLCIDKLPNVLCIVLKRFCWTETSRAKIDTIVKFPVHQLNLKNYATETTNTLFDLQSVVIHHGYGLRAGHYTAVCFNPEKGSWYHYNDSKVSSITIEEVLELQTPYLLFYERKSSDNKS